MAYGIFWMTCLSVFAEALSSSGVGTWDKFAKRAFTVAVSAVSMCTPIAMTMDPASVSTSCDELLAELNVRRCELFGNDRPSTRSCSSKTRDL